MEVGGKERKYGMPKTDRVSFGEEINCKSHCFELQ